MSDQNWIIEAVGLSKTYHDGKQDLCIFDELEFRLRAGESVGIVGSSGAGKTTLLNLLGGLDRPSSGAVRLCGVDVTVGSEKQVTALRNKYLGFVYQFHHLLPEFTATENVAMPLYIAGVAKREADQRADQYLAKVGLTARASHKPSELSGGERQRVAIARALVNQPKCVMMDEPTGNLDETTAAGIQDILLSLQRSLKTSVVVVTHDRQLARRMDRVLLMEAGKLRDITHGE